MSDGIPVVGIKDAKAILRKILGEIGKAESQGIFLWGPPGIGKSALVKQLAEEKKCNLVDLRLPLMDPVDLRGLPMISKEKQQAVWLPPDFLPDKNSEPGILFLDEINAASPAIQASAYQLILDRRVGTYKLPKGWIVIAAGNRISDRSVAYRLPTALANRFTHLTISPTIDEWTEWAWKNDIDPYIIAFLRFQPSILMGFNPRSNSIAFPSPRSWSFVSNLQSLRDEDLLLYSKTIHGTIGDAAKQQFISFLNYRDTLPDPNDILDGKPYEIPQEIDSLYVLMGGLIRSLIERPTDERITNIYNFIYQFEETQYSDFGVVVVKEMALAFSSKNKINLLMQHQSYGKWISRHKDVLKHDF